LDDELSNEGVSPHIKSQIDLGIKLVFEDLAKDEVPEELKKLIEQLKAQNPFEKGEPE